MDLNKLNSITKYPSILTYHKMGERGRLLDNIQVPFNEPVILTEKVDGTNGRIIMFPNGLYIIGSREELLYAKGDLIGNPQLGIVDALKPLAESIKPREELMVYYLEVYGGNIGKNSNQYSGSGNVGYRLFDVSIVFDYDDLMKMPIEQIAIWRESGHQYFCDEERLQTIGISLTPRILIDRIPTELQNTYEWLKTKIQKTQVALDEEAMLSPEGIVARTSNRSRIAKLRFEDYNRTFR